MPIYLLFWYLRISLFSLIFSCIRTLASGNSRAIPNLSNVAFSIISFSNCISTLLPSTSGFCSQRITSSESTTFFISMWNTTKRSSTKIFKFRYVDQITARKNRYTTLQSSVQVRPYVSMSMKRIGELRYLIVHSMMGFLDLTVNNSVTIWCLLCHNRQNLLLNS